MNRQTLRDWVIRFNERGQDGLINIPSPGVPPKLGKKHRAFLARLVEEGPIPAVDGVVRWRAGDLIMRLYEEFGLSVSDDTIYRALKDLGFSYVSARPKAYKQDPDAMEAFKKTLPTALRKSAPSSRRGSRTRCGSARRTSLPIVGQGRARVPEPLMINAPNRPIFRSYAASSREIAATVTAGAHASSIRPAGTAPRT